MAAEPDVIQWLLSAECPPARFLTARDLLAKTPSTKKLQEMRSAMLEWPPLVAVLKKQRDDGSFPWTQKARSAQPTFAALELMAACGMSIQDKPVAEALDALERFHQPRKHPGVVSYLSGGGGVLPCYTGIVVHSLIRLGALAHPLVAGSIDWLVAHQRFDHRKATAGGDQRWPYTAPTTYRCWESVSCYHGVVGTLRALAAVPKAKRTPVIRKRIAEAVAYLKPHRVYLRTHDEKPIVRHLKRFFIAGEYRSDLIDVLDALSNADPSLSQEDWVRHAAADVDELSVNGRVLQVESYAKRVADPLNFEPIGEPSRLLTFRWLLVKKRFGLA